MTTIENKLAFIEQSNMSSLYKPVIQKSLSLSILKYHNWWIYLQNQIFIRQVKIYFAHKNLIKSEKLNKNNEILSIFIQILSFLLNFYLKTKRNANN